MFSPEEIQALDDLSLFKFMLETQDLLIAIWRSIPAGQTPTQQQSEDITKLEAYTMLFVKELVKRGKLPQSWEAK